MKKAFLLKTLSLPLFLFSLFIVSNTATAQVNLDSGLVGYYAFNDNLVDSSTVGTIGIGVDLTPSTGIKNQIKTAYHFNGTTSVVKCSNSNRGIQSVVSLSVWMKTTVISPVSQFIVSKYDWRVDKGYFVGVKEGYPYIAGRNTSGAFSKTENSTKFVADGNWHHVLGVVSENEWQIWVDGVLAKNYFSNASNPLLTNTQSLNIGNYEEGNQGNQYFYSGVLDQVRIFDRELTTDEIAYLSSENTITGLNNLEINLEVSVYPNPTSSFMKIETSFTVYQVEVYSIQGKRIGWVDIENGMVNVSFLPTGVYLLEITDMDSQRTVVKRFMKN